MHLIKTSGVVIPNLYSYNYWSSTELSQNNAFVEVLGNYANNYNSHKQKNTAEGIKVRAIRSFYSGIKGDQGPQGIAGNDGADGDSAYDIWLSLGNTGTQQDFIDSLTGPQGGTTSSVSTYNINTYYAELGGYVIDVNDDGTSGVVVAMQNQSEYTNWWDAFNLANDPTLHDSAGKKFRDWRLPTKRELELMWQVYENGNEPNLWGGGNSGWLWSSSEHWDGQNINNAWSHTHLQGGITDFKPKTFLYALRAVRSFLSSSNNSSNSNTSSNPNQTLIYLSDGF